jgi:hypothetical protein
MDDVTSLHFLPLLVHVESYSFSASERETDQHAADTSERERKKSPRVSLCISIQCDVQALVVIYKDT